MELRKKKRVDYAATAKPNQPSNQDIPTPPATNSETKLEDSIENKALLANTAKLHANNHEIERTTLNKMKTIPLTAIPRKFKSRTNQPDESSIDSNSSESTNNSNHNSMSDSKESERIMNLLTLKRPPLFTVPEQQTQIEPAVNIMGYADTLDRLIREQYESYYKGLTTPKVMGPKHFENLKVPDDIVNMKKISCHLKTFIDYKCLLESRERDIMYSSAHFDKNQELKLFATVQHIESQILNRPTIDTEITDEKPIDEEEEAIKMIANIHGINAGPVQDIKCKTYTADGKINFDPNLINHQDIRIINRRIDRPLLREKNNNLTWPNKNKKKLKKLTKTNRQRLANDPALKFRNVPLYNSI